MSDSALARAQATTTAPFAPPAGRARWGWVRRHPLVAVGLVLIALVIAAALLAPVLPLKDPNVTAPAKRLSAPGVNGFLLGSDQLGRDLLSRLVWGARVSISVAAIAAAGALVVGGAIGLVAGFYGGVVDNVAMRAIDMLMAFPYVLLAIALVAALGPGLTNAMIAISVVNVSFYARGVRAATLVARRMTYIEAARAAGASDVRILLREVVPNILPPLLVFASLNVGWMVVETAGLSFIGLGAQPPTADWGTMLADGRQFMMVSPHVAAVPGVAILVLVLGFNLVGDGVRDMLDPAFSRAVR